MRYEEDLFEQYVNGQPRPILQVISEIDEGGYITKKFTFSSRDGINTVYAIMAFPKTAGVFPGILLLHGGSGSADDLLSKVQAYAQSGYVALAPDLVGLCADTTPSEGPWKSKPYGITTQMDVSNGAGSSAVFDAEVAAIEAFNILRSQSGVDPDNIGVTGWSWGGYSTTFISGILGSRVKASYAVYGCGFYDKGSKWQSYFLNDMSETERNTWFRYLDAGRRAGSIKSVHFMEAASNDKYFWPEAVMATMDQIPEERRNLVFGPNLDHEQIGVDMQKIYFDYCLKGIGSPFPKINVEKIIKDDNGNNIVYFKADVPPGLTISSQKLYYSEPDCSWPSREWVKIDAQGEGENLYRALVPAPLAEKNINWYVYVTDSRSVAVSSYIYGNGKK